MNIRIVKNTINKAPLALLVSAAFMFPMMSWGAQNCDKPVNDFDGLYCLNKVYLEADKELNNAYAKLAKQLNTQQKSKLKRGQLAWIRARNEDCSYHDGDDFYVNLACTNRVTTERVNFLTERVRECSAGSCRDSRLGE